MVQSISNRMGITITKNYNEYNFIKESISATIDEKERIDLKFKEQNITIRSSFLSNLIKGTRDTNAPIDEVLSSFDIKFESDYFAILLFYIADFGALFEDEIYDYDYHKQIKLVYFIVTNVVEELVAKKHYGIVTEVDGMMACLVNIHGNSVKDYKEDLNEIAVQALKHIEQDFFIKSIITISDVCSSITGITQAYNNAMETMEYRMVMENKKIIHYSEIKNPQSTYYYPLEVEQRLINFIKIGDFQNSKEIIEQIFERNFSKQLLSIGIAKCLLFDLVSTMIKTTDQLGEVGDGSFFDELNPVELLLKCETRMEMKYHMINILKKVCEHIDTHKRSQGEKLKDDIVEFIKNNYHDVNLCVSVVADNFGFTPTYLSKQFKEQMGESLLDYINRFRLDKAKQLLKDLELSITDIASEAGYNNSNAFIRVFKKYEGITPGKYRNVHYSDGDKSVLDTSSK